MTNLKYLCQSNPEFAQAVIGKLLTEDGGVEAILNELFPDIDRELWMRSQEGFLVLVENGDEPVYKLVGTPESRG